MPAGLLLAIGVQEWLSGYPGGVAVGLAALTLCGIAVAVTLHTAQPPAAPPSVGVHRASWRWLPAAGALAGVFCALIGATQVTSAVWTAQHWWLAAVILPLAALAVDWGILRYRHSATRPHVAWSEVGLAGALFALALAVRAPAITTLPPFVHGDEASCGIFARQFNAGQAPLLSASWYGLSMFSYAVSGVGLRLLGDSLEGLRLTNAVLGSACVVLVYLLGRELFGRRAAILSALVLAVSFLAVDLSRDGIHYIQGPLCITLTLYLVVRWWRHGGALTAFLAGMSLIVDLQVYWSARVAPLLVVFLLAYLAISERRVRAARWRSAGWMVAGALAYGAPVLALFVSDPGSFGGHQVDVNILNGDPGTMQHLQSVYGTTNMLTILLQQTWRIATTFNALGDASLQIGWSGAMLDTVSAALLPAALALALLRWRRWPYALCLAWFGAVAAAGVLTIDPPWWPRLAALLPAVALLLGVLLEECLRAMECWLSSRKRLALAGAGLLLLCLGIGNLRLVFIDYPAAASQADTMGPTLVGRFLEHAPGARQAVVLSDGMLDLNHPTIRFLAPQAGGCTLMPGDALRACPLGQSSHLYLLLPGRVGDVAWLQRQRPGGHVVTVGAYWGGANRILAYELPVARNGAVASAARLNARSQQATRLAAESRTTR